jgi:hypothetical protein
MGLHVHMTMLEEMKRAAWGRTNPVSTMQLNAWEFRKDCLGNLVRFSDYGNRHSPFGWELDHIVPRMNGGTSDAENLQALHWRATAARADNVPAGLKSAANSVAAARSEESIPDAAMS